MTAANRVVWEKKEKVYSTARRKRKEREKVSQPRVRGAVFDRLAGGAAFSDCASCESKFHCRNRAR